MPHFMPKSDQQPSVLQRSLGYGLSLLLIWQPALLAAAEPVSPTHSTNGRPTLDQAANGVPIVNIQNPNGQGVSQNFYNELNVGSQGLILNNSQQLTQTQLGGYIEGNPNLTNGSANLILNEVIGANPSSLNGYMEVGGRRADVVVANPNGITCNGCGFINTNHATLTTGTAIMEGGSLSGFDVQGGNIHIGENGLNASNTNRFDLIARSVEVAGELHADQLNIVTGQQTVNRNTLETSNVTTDGDKPSFAIDSTALGGMYANRIRLIANEDGVGVKLDAPVAAQNGDLVLSAEGALSFGDASAKGNMQVASASSVSTTGSVVAGGMLEVDAKILNVEAGNVGADVVSIRVDESTLASGASMTGDSGIIVHAEQGVVNQGEMLAGGQIAVTTKDFTNTGTVAGQGNVNISATDQLVNSGQLDAIDNLEITTASLNNTSGALQAGQALSLTTQDYQHLGEVQAEGELNLEAETVFIGTEADWQVLGDVSVKAAELRNEGVFSSSGAMTMEVTNLDNHGDIAGMESVFYSGEKLSNAEHSLLLSAGQMQLYLNELDNFGDIYAVGDMDIAGGELQGSLDEIWADKDRWANRVNNESGLIASEGSTRIVAANIFQQLISAPEVEVAWDAPVYSYDRDYDRRCFNRNRNSECHDTTYRNKYQRQSVQSVSAPRQSRMLAGGDLWLLGDYLLNNASVIAAGNDIEIKATRFENIAITQDLKEVYRVDKSWLRKRDSAGGSKKKYYTYTTIPTSENWALCDSSRVSCNRAGATSHTNILTETVINALVSAGGKLNIDAELVTNGEEKEGAAFSFGSAMQAVYGENGQHNADTLFRFDPLSLGFSLPGEHGLFILRTDPGHPYLIETNPLFATLSGFMGSQYLINRLGMTPDREIQRLGDSYYETTLVRDAVLAATGARFLDPDFESDEEQFRWLMDNAFAAAESLELSVGVALTADQVNALQQDIVWLEEKEVAGYRVMVPVLYLAKGGAVLDGPQLRGEEVLITGEQVSNHGEIHAANTATINAGQGGITNSGGMYAGESLNLRSDGDIKNLGGQLIAQSLNLDAEGSVEIATLAEAVGDSLNWMTRLTEQAELRAENLRIRSAEDIQIQGAQVNAGVLALEAGGDLSVGSVSVSQGSHMDQGDVKFTQSKVRQLGSNLNSTVSMLLETENDLSIIASDLSSEGDINLKAKGDIVVGYAQESDSLYSYRKDDGSFGSSKKQTVEAESQRVVGSNLIAQGNLILNAEKGSISLLASHGHGEKSVDVASGKGINIESAVNTEYHRRRVEEKNAVRIKTSDSGSITQTLAQAGLSSGGGLALNAQDDVTLGAAQLEAQGDLTIGEAAFAKDESGVLKLDENGNPIIERGSIDNLNIGTVTLENESWSVRTRELRGPVKDLAKVSSAMLGLGALYMPGLALAGKESEIELSEHVENRVQQSRQVGSSLQAENVQLSAQNDIAVTGSSIAADQESGRVVVLAENILLDTAVTDTTTTQRDVTETASSIDPSLKEDEISLGGLRLTELEQATVIRDINHTGSSISANQIFLEAEGGITLINADLYASGEDGTLSLTGEEINVTGVQDEHSVSETLTEKTSELTLSVRNAYVDAAYAVKRIEEAGEAVDDARRALKEAERKVERGELAKEALEDYRIMLAAATANFAQAELAGVQALAAAGQGAAAGGTGFYASGSAQHTETTTTSLSSEKTWQGSSLSASAMSINAGTANIIGSDITAGLLELNASDILIGAGTNEQSSSYQQESQNAGFSASSSGKGSWNANAGFNEADSESQATQYVNSQFNIGHLASNSESLTVKGGLIAANTAAIETETLHIESLQDTHSSSNSSFGANLGIGGGTDSKGVAQGASAGFNMAEGSGEGARTNQQSAILVADGENSQITARDTTLIGGMIANASYEEDAETGGLTLVDHGNLNFSTETLTVENLRDYSRSEQQGGGLQVSKATTTISLQDTGHQMEGETLATIGAGNVSVGGVSLDDHADYADLNRDIHASQVVTLDQQTGALDASVTVDNRVVGLNGGWKDIKKNHIDSRMFLGHMSRSAKDIVATDFKRWNFFDSVSKYARDAAVMEQQAANEKQQKKLRGDEGAEGSKEGLQQLENALASAHGLDEAAEVNLYDGGQLADDTPTDGPSDFNKTEAMGGYHDDQSDIYVNVDSTDMTDSSQTVQVLVHEHARHQMSEEGNDLPEDHTTLLAFNRGERASKAWELYSSFYGFSTQGDTTVEQWNSDNRFSPVVLGGTQQLASIDSREVEPLLQFALLAGVIAWEGAVIHDEVVHNESFEEAALKKENLLFGAGVTGTVVTGGTLGPTATTLLVGGGMTGDIAHQNLVEGVPLTEVDYFDSVNSGLFVGSIGAPAQKLLVASNTARWTLMPGMTGYGAYDSTGYILGGYESGNWGEVAYGGAGLVMLAGGLGAAKWGDNLNFWPQSNGLRYGETIAGAEDFRFFEVDPVSSSVLRGSIPQDINVSSIADNPGLHFLWEESMKHSAKRSRVYKDYLDVLGKGEIPSADQARAAFNAVRNRYNYLAKQQGFDVEGVKIHHWNWPIGDYPTQAVNPQQLFPVLHDKHMEIHRLLTSGHITNDPISEKYVLTLEDYYLLYQ
ncbi:hemagglutinin/hemolysin-related protein [Alcanivorax nanhaiticus]|uniref:Hemagglutinin/hemolysin-related protein n=1 Tax=Alcanivorax nanhaiticus TaxID=1177154 RepID=A0A095US75_9GAMM|nr:hemagglutinin repeat-containing protein [Alcanivorax nanhaiticus]KGD65390.1 hemagglutinin/hemolysin-related protein [Alcanivorax nanhaiticus]